VSSARLESIGQTLKAVNLRNVFDGLVGAQHVTHSKPHPEPYLRIAERFKVEPAECLVFEDSEVGIVSARGAGRAACPGARA
jgi:HAD superfamily hydrolase (TIGR01509 family)